MPAKKLQDEIVCELQMFQISVADPFFVPEKAAEICTQQFRGEVDDFVNDLLAFRMNCGVGDDKPLTQEFLDNYERSRTNYEATSGGHRKKGQPIGNTPLSRTPFSSRSVSKPKTKKSATIFLDYGLSDAANGNGANEEFFTDNAGFEDAEPMDETEVFTRCRTPPSVITSDTFSPAGATPSHLFAERQNSGKAEVSFGDVHSTDWIADRKPVRDNAVLVQHGDMVPVLDKPYEFMNQTIRSVQEALNNRIEYMVEQMQKACPEVGDHLKESTSQQESLVYICGVLANGDEADRATRLVPDKILLRDKKDSSDGIPVDVSSLSDYSLFPGEVVCFGGRMVGKEKLVAEKLIAGALPPVATFDSSSLSGVPDRLSIVFASGPFTPVDGFGYEPLVALLNYVQKHRPHVLVLIGPFVPTNREDILTLPMPCDEFLDHVLPRIVEACNSSETKLVVVASADDMTMLPCYPTPPHQITHSLDKKQPLFVSDPCLLRIGGLLFGFTATDVLFHLSSEETKAASADVGGDRMCRLARHLLLQQTFYPLYPPLADVGIDLEQANTYAKLPVAPHVLVLPSVLKYFVKDVGNVLAVNPGFLTKGRGGGTFCRMEFDRRMLANQNGEVMKCIRAQVVRI